MMKVRMGIDVGGTCKAVAIDQRDHGCIGRILGQDHPRRQGGRCHRRCAGVQNCLKESDIDPRMLSLSPTPPTWATNALIEATLPAQVGVIGIGGRPRRLDRQGADES